MSVGLPASGSSPRLPLAGGLTSLRTKSWTPLIGLAEVLTGDRRISIRSSTRGRGAEAAVARTIMHALRGRGPDGK
jgi:hypothetical protein